MVSQGIEASVLVLCHHEFYLLPGPLSMALEPLCLAALGEIFPYILLSLLRELWELLMVSSRPSSTKRSAVQNDSLLFFLYLMACLFQILFTCFLAGKALAIFKFICVPNSVRQRQVLTRTLPTQLCPERSVSDSLFSGNS